MGAIGIVIQFQTCRPKQDATGSASCPRIRVRADEVKGDHNAMPSLLIKNIDHKLLADVNHAAAVAEMNQREWVIEALAQAVGKPLHFDTKVQLTTKPAPERNYEPEG